MIFPNFQIKKFLSGTYFLVNKNYKFENLKKLNQKLLIFCDIYDLSLFSSLRAFLPSLRVLEVSQASEKIIKEESVISEIRVSLISMINLLKWF